VNTNRTKLTLCVTANCALSGHYNGLSWREVNGQA